MARLLVLIGRQDLVDPLLAEQVVLQIVGVLAAARGGGGVHPLQLLRSLPARLFLLQALQLLQLALFLLFLAELVEFLLLLELRRVPSIQSRFQRATRVLRTAFFSSSQTRS